MRAAGTAAACLLAVAVGLAPGCRKSTREQERELQKEQAELKQDRKTIETTQETGEREYQQIKDMVARGEYDAAWTQLDELAKKYKEIEFKSIAYKKNGLPDEVFRQAEELSDIRVERYEEAYARLQWIHEHIEAKRDEASKRAAVVSRRWQARDLYRQGVLKKQQFRGGEAVAILERVKNEYADTPYAALAEQQLLEIQGPPRQ
ncbi:MAG: hypothetical protein JW889_02350 [Verrucomicrobia bacterium]|nr:hypothetical protein [Verrucomicrobiota bacterium]